MKLLLTAACLCLPMALPAFAQTATTTGTATAAAPESALSGLGALLAAGYEIRSTQPLSIEDQLKIYPNDPVLPFTLIVLQKGTSIATCVYSTSNLIFLQPEALAFNNTCRVN